MMRQRRGQKKNRSRHRYAFNAAFNVQNKIILNQFPYPWAASWVQLAAGILFFVVGPRGNRPPGRGLSVGRVAATPWVPREYSEAGSRRRRGYHVDIPRLNRVDLERRRNFDGRRGATPAPRRVQ